MKVTYYVASSLDGYIAREDGDVSWLDNFGISLEEAGYEEFYSTVGGLVMGRKTSLHSPYRNPKNLIPGDFSSSGGKCIFRQ